jgi:hypothetical protein
MSRLMIGLTPAIVQKVAGVASQHHKFTVGHVDHPHHPEDDGEPHGHEAVESTDHDAAQDCFVDRCQIHPLLAPEAWRNHK